VTTQRARAANRTFELRDLSLRCSARLAHLAEQTHTGWCAEPRRDQGRQPKLRARGHSHQTNARVVREIRRHRLRIGIEVIARRIVTKKSMPNWRNMRVPLRRNSSDRKVTTRPLSIPQHPQNRRPMLKNIHAAQPTSSPARRPGPASGSFQRDLLSSQALVNWLASRGRRSTFLVMMRVEFSFSTSS
jgi:hypothetical protein